MENRDQKLIKPCFFNFTNAVNKRNIHTNTGYNASLFCSLGYIFRTTFDVRRNGENTTTYMKILFYLINKRIFSLCRRVYGWTA